MYLILAIIKQSFSTHSEIHVLSETSSDIFVTILEIFGASYLKSLWQSLFSVQFQAVNYQPKTILAKDFTTNI